MLRGYVAMGSGNCRFRRRKHSFAQLPGKFRMKRQAHGGADLCGINSWALLISALA